MKPQRSLSIALVALAALFATLPGSALAAAELGVDLQREPTVVPANFEQVTYRVAVKNNANAVPAPGDELECKRGSWNNEGTIAYAFSYQWVRDGVRLTSVEDLAHGSQTATYTIQAADGGKALQCVVTGENPNTENSNDSTTGHRTASSIYSQPARVVAPAPATPPPGPSLAGTATRPFVEGVPGAAGSELTCYAPVNYWNTVATAATKAGSKTLTVATAHTMVVVAPNSNKVFVQEDFGVVGVHGEFRVGQTVTIGEAVLAPGTTITAVDGRALTLSNPVTSIGPDPRNHRFTAGAQPLEVGQAISGEGIPSGATITAINGRQVEISAPAEATAPEALLKVPAAGIGVWSFEWLLNGVPRSGGPGEGEVTATTNTTSTFKVAAAELEQPGAFQCVAYASNAGGVMGLPGSLPVSTAAPAPVIPAGTLPSVHAGLSKVDVGSPTEGPVSLEIELPGGLETQTVSVDGGGIGLTAWDCDSFEPTELEHARLECTQDNALAPQQSYPEVVIKASMGADRESPAIATATVSGGGSASASDSDQIDFAEPVAFGIKSLATMVKDQDGNDFTQAGGHPLSASVKVELNTRTGRDGKRAQVEFLKDIKTDTPPGFVANPQAVPLACESLSEVLNDKFSSPTCPRQSIVGSVTIDTRATDTLAGLPLYRIKPQAGVPAQFVFSINGLGLGYSLIPRLRPEDGYAISVDAPAAAKNPVIFSAEVRLCGYGVNVENTLPASWYVEGPKVSGCKMPGDVGANPKPFVTNPTECTGVAPITKLSIASWENPDVFKSETAASPLVTGCETVPFSPTTSLRPSEARADSPTGLDVSIQMPTDGLETSTGIAQSALRKAVVTLPEGVAVNPSAADGLGACTSAQIKLGSNDPVECPDSAKVGTARVETPLLAETLEGSVYLAKQGDNPFGSLLALYLVVESKQRGILVKIPGRVETDPRSGQIVSTFDDNPQVPFSSLDLHFNTGNRAALISPPKCGSYAIVSQLYPYANPGQPVRQVSGFEVSAGPGGSPCPVPSLSPKLRSGVQNPVAASTSPFVVGLSREDGTERFGSLDLELPPGLTAYLKGIPYCADSTLASIPTAEGTGQGEIDNPSCPAASQIGTVSVGAGAGGSPFYVHTARAYLAGPYKGAPLSIAVVAPAVAGPFDLGNVVVRNAAYVDPATAQITVVSDPIPTILHGIPIDVRDIRVSVDRPAFTLAPTNCEAMSVRATVGGELGASAVASNRFQVGECASLAFKPKLSLRLTGSTRRAGNPALTAKLAFPPGRNANAMGVSVALPRSEFLDQSHIRTVCTRVQFAANACPPGSVYGRAEASSPLLDYKLSGNVYLRSNGGERLLPDLVVALRGPAHQPLAVDLVGFVDSKNGGIRTTFQTAPDAPVSSFTLRMQGGKKGLLDNSRDICRHRNRATVRMDAHNGMTQDFRPVLQVRCGGKGEKRVKGSAKRTRRGG